MMETTAFRSDDFPPEERFERFRGKVRRVYSADASSEHAADYFAHERDIGLGAATISHKVFLPMRVRRTAAAPFRAGSDVVQVSVIHRGCVRTTWTDEDSVSVSGGLYVHDPALVDTSVFRTPDGEGFYRATCLMLPKSLLVLPLGKVERLYGEPLPAEQGFGALLRDFLRHLALDDRAFGPDDGPRLGTIAADLVGALFGNLLAAESQLPPETRAGALTTRIRSFIQSNLADPRLTPSAIAEAHHISVSYVHRLFRSEGTTVSAMIRSQRLERTRRVLSDPALREVPIHAVAARCGFSSPADFSRAFRSAYGITPRDFRRQALDPAGQS